MKFTIAMVSMLLCFTQCCTMSITNIETHGEATDVFDQEQTQEGQFDAEATIPLA